MVDFDFSDIDYSNLDLMSRKDEVLNSFKNSYMTGWTRDIDKSLVNDIISVRNKVMSNSDCLVVVGIGGSFLGSYAVSKALAPYFEDSKFKVIYAGTSLSSDYITELLAYLKNVDFSLKVISKSGTTMEPTIAYTLIRELMEEKYSEDIFGKLKKYIDAHYTDRLTLTMIAEDVHANGSYLSRLYKAKTGQNLFDAINKMRLEQAKRYLSEGRRISDIAFLVGFEDVSYFSRVFKKYENCSPRDYEIKKEREKT